MGVDDYDRIVSPIEGRMMQTVWRILGNTEDAEDALQSAFLTVWRRLHKVCRHPNPTALVLRICANAAYDVLRGRLSSPQAELRGDPEDPAGSVDESLMQDERRQAVRQAISQLSRKQAVAVLLRDIEDQPYAEVAQALGCRESTARKHVARGRNRPVWRVSPISSRLGSAMSIRILPSTLTNKIAAGEVIERPASVVKELVENCLDAGASRVEVELENAGAELIRVVDDGGGMDADDLALAFASHATSKLAEEEDLFRVRTMGFRGEALASVGSVSDARIVSRIPQSDAGHEVEMRAGAISPVKACGAPVGTQIEVRRLFYNVPVRKKFLKTSATEMAHITEALTRLALARPDVHFVLKHNARSVFNLPPAPDRAQRIGEFFGREIADNMIPLRHEREGFAIEGYLLPPTIDRRNTKMQYTYVNGRYVRDSNLMHAVAQAYEGLMIPGRRPICFLFLTMDPGAVDVNVHPTKLEVKFRNPRELHAHCVSAMRECLREASVIPQVALSPQEEPARESVRLAIGDFFAGRAAAPLDAAGWTPGRHALHGFTPAPREDVPAPQTAGVRSAFGSCMQVLDTYIVEETPVGVNLIDQHALHERILYNQIRRRLEEGGLTSQQLLVPELVELPRQEFFAVMALAEELGRFGMAIEAFGERTVIVRAFPQVLGRFDGRTFFQDLLDELEGPQATLAPQGAQRVDGRLEKIVRLMACRGAVKAGKRLSPEQMRHLLESRADAGPTDTCPHGRPTTILLSREELERQFRRI